jgi:hypothetical protein
VDSAESKMEVPKGGTMSRAQHSRAEQALVQIHKMELLIT